MKRILILLLTSVILVACGNSEVESIKSHGMVKVHENIGDEVLGDVNGVIEEIENNIVEGNHFTEASFSTFLDKYESELDYVSSEEFELIMALSFLMMSLDGYINGDYDLSDDINRLYETARTGEHQPLNRKDEYYKEYYENVASLFYDSEQEPEEELKEESKNEHLTEGVLETEDTVETEDSKEEVDQSQSDINSIDAKVKNVVRADLENTTITNLRVNEDASVDEDRYIVLVDLTWDVKNDPNTTKKMLDMYSDHLASKVVDNEMIYELVLFWTVPYHNEDDSILKRTYQNKDGGMYLEDEIKDNGIFN